VVHKLEAKTKEYENEKEKETVPLFLDKIVTEEDPSPEFHSKIKTEPIYPGRGEE